jgi:hypothetical protein
LYLNLVIFDFFKNRALSSKIAKLLFTIILLSNLLNIWEYGSVLAHAEAVQVVVTFPTLKNNTKLHLVITSVLSGSLVTGAIIDLEFSKGVNQRSFNFHEIKSGYYETPEVLPVGNYIITIVDRTFPQEELRYRVTGDLPRPSNNNTLFWTWPATRTNSIGQNSTPIWIFLMGLPIVLIFIGFIIRFTKKH